MTEIKESAIFWHLSNACFFSGADHRDCWDAKPEVRRVLDGAPHVTRCPCKCHQEKP
jgi:hypothetical protein